MALCYPAIFTTAMFTALFVLDLITKNYNDIGFHISGGVFSVLGIYTACQLAGEMAGWALLAIPFVFLIIGLGLIWADSQKDPKPPVNPAPVNPCPCPYCYDCPCRCRKRRCPTPSTPTPDLPSEPSSPSPPSQTPDPVDPFNPPYVSPPSPFTCKTKA